MIVCTTFQNWRNLQVITLSWNYDQWRSEMGAEGETDPPTKLPKRCMSENLPKFLKFIGLFGNIFRFRHCTKNRRSATDRDRKWITQNPSITKSFCIEYCVRIVYRQAFWGGAFLKGAKYLNKRDRKMIGWKSDEFSPNLIIVCLFDHAKHLFYEGI